ncbi:oocyte zinc finger protein XlCOF15-like [Argiope bruennichi]|nr:oocyte zinc finger protein XlCOF15-like [Argiope bruennichi]
MLGIKDLGLSAIQDSPFMAFHSKSGTSSVQLIVEENKQFQFRMFTCSVCHKKFSQKANLLVHFRVHTGHLEIMESCKKLSFCPYCPYATAHKGHMQRHKRIHTNERPFVCVVCHKRFNRKDHVLSHMKSHSKELPYPCQVCSHRFYTKNDMLRHFAEHFADNTSSDA